MLRELLKVWVEAKEPRHLNHKHKVEVGWSRYGCVVPLEAVLDKVVEEMVALLGTGGEAKELGDEE